MIIRTIVANAIAIQRFSCETKAKRLVTRDNHPIIAWNNEAYPSFFAASEIRKIRNGPARSRYSIAASSSWIYGAERDMKVRVSFDHDLRPILLLRTRSTTASDQHYSRFVTKISTSEIFVPDVQSCQFDADFFHDN